MATSRSRDDGRQPKRGRKKTSFGGRTVESAQRTVDDGGSKPKKGVRRTKKDERKTVDTMATVAEDSYNNQPEDDANPKSGNRKSVVPKKGPPRRVPSKTPSCAAAELAPQLTEEQRQAIANYRMAPANENVGEFLKRALLREKPVEALVAEFRVHKRTIDATKMTAFAANAFKNRYKDVGCLDHNRVVLRLGGQPYIHANYVGAGHDPKKFICCQAPIDTTVVDFWHMVAQEGTRCIVMLCNYIEKNMPKCAHYLPAVPNVPQTFGLVTVTALRSERLALPSPSKTVINRTILSLTWESASPVQSVSPSNSTHTAHAIKHHLQVEHLHWVDWPDRGVPPADNVPIELVQHVQKHIGSPIVVHCSAGIGRTGCFVMMDILLGLFNKRMPWPADLQVVLDEIRQSRSNSIQTEQQFLYCHQVMINFLKKGCLLTSEMVKVHYPWTFSYTKVCEAFN